MKATLATIARAAARFGLNNRPWRADFDGGPLDGATKELLDSRCDEWLFIVDTVSGPTEVDPRSTPEEVASLIEDGRLHAYRLKPRRLQRLTPKRYTYAGRVRLLAPGIAGFFGP